VKFYYSTTAQGIEVSSGKVTGVATNAGRLPADAVVVALGSFSAPLLAKLGIRVPIYPVKGISITFPRGAWNSAPSHPVIDDSKLFGLVPIGDRMRISGSAEITGYDVTPAMPRAEAIIANASYTFPELSRHLDRSKARIWAGLRPVSPAGTPLLGPTAMKGLFINAGHGHLGWTLACGSGRVVADMVAGRKAEIGLPGSQGVTLPNAA
jgi:D-amino-acid dehydrogenase